MRKRKLLLVLAAVGFLMAASLVPWQRISLKSAVTTLPSPATPPAASQPTVTVTEHDITFAVTAAGEIGPLDAVSVRPEIGGLISKLVLDIGDRVKKGDVLFELDDKELQTERISRQIEIAGASLAVETQRVLLEKSELGFRRQRSLFEDKLIAQEVFDNGRLDYELARNHLAIASNRLDTARSILQQVEDRLLKTVIRAPFDCTILARPVSVGQAVSGANGYNSGTEVFTIANLADMIITAHINQSDVTRLTVGQAVKVEVEAVAGLALTGRVDRIAPLATLKSGVKGFATRVRLSNAENVVRPGMTANLTIPLVSAGNVLAIPIGAVFNDKGDRYVHLQRGQGFERQPIQIGRADYEFVEVIAGLRKGDIISLVAPSMAARPAAPTGSSKAAGPR